MGMNFPLRINASLLVAAIAFAAISTLFDEEPIGIMLLVAAWALTLVAVVPSLVGYARERIGKRKGRYVDPDTVVPGWKQFCQSMGIEKDIRMKVFTNLRNAYAHGATIDIGQPVLNSLDSASIKAVFAHELAHIKINDAVRLRHLLAPVLAGAILVGVIRATIPLVFTYSIGQLVSSYSTLSVLSILVIGLMGIAVRFMSWPGEYRADLVAMQRVSRRAVVSFLTAMAALRKTDVMRDFYLHPSVNKRKANLGWSPITRFRKWYIEP
jgi:Zn-dependent protease with chaperone function